MTPIRGEVWLVNLDPTIGVEIRKVRPAVVVSRDAIGVLALRAEDDLVRIADGLKLVLEI